MRTDYLSPEARHNRHRYEWAAAALHRLLGPELAEQIMEGHTPVEALSPADTAAGEKG
jgi:hypothetical protein